MAGIDLTLFAQNLRKHRCLRGLTQKELGHQLGFSEKTVSKWECGAAIPDVQTLFSMCRLFRISMETLFSESGHYYLGIDGGGTKTALVLIDSEGNVLKKQYFDACNPVDIGLDAAKKILQEAIYSVCEAIPLSSVTMFAGIAGGSSGHMKQSLREFFQTFGFSDFDNDSDNLNIIAAGLWEQDGITVILGTGFCVYTQKNRSHRRFGGWGYLMDGGGSGYDLGRDALGAYFSAYDGTGVPTGLTARIDARCPDGVTALLAQIYGNNAKKAVASFAPVVFEALREGDPVAEQILRRNMEHVAHVIATAAKEFGNEPVPVVLAGGLTKEPAVLRFLRQALPGQMEQQLQVLKEEPVIGAAMLARKMGGEPHA